MKDFLIYNTIGSMSWNIILAVPGYFFYSQKELLDNYYTDLSLILLGFGVIYVAYLVYKGFKKRKIVEPIKD